MGFTNIIYLTLCKYSMAAFLCESLPHVDNDPFSQDRAPDHPKEVLKAYPEMACWTGQHWFYVSLGATGLILYLFGLPCFIGLILRWIQTNKLHTKHDIVVAFGALYTKCTHTPMHMRKHARWHAHTQTCTHVYVCTHARLHTCAHTCAHTRIISWHVVCMDVSM